MLKLPVAVGQSDGDTHTHTHRLCFPYFVCLLLMGTQGSHSAICSQLSHSVPLLVFAYNLGRLA